MQAVDIFRGEANDAETIAHDGSVYTMDDHKMIASFLWQQVIVHMSVLLLAPGYISIGCESARIARYFC